MPRSAATPVRDQAALSTLLGQALPADPQRWASIHCQPAKQPFVQASWDRLGGDGRVDAAWGLTDLRDTAFVLFRIAHADGTPAGVWVERMSHADAETLGHGGRECAHCTLEPCDQWAPSQATPEQVADWRDASRTWGVAHDRILTPIIERSRRGELARFGTVDWKVGQAMPTVYDVLARNFNLAVEPGDTPLVQVPGIDARDDCHLLFRWSERVAEHITGDPHRCWTVLRVSEEQADLIQNSGGPSLDSFRAVRN